MSARFVASASNCDAIRRNIETVARLEEKFQRERTLVDRMADSIGGFTGSMGFVLLHLIAFVIYFLWNNGHFFGLHPFDPFPYLLLSMGVSLEAIFLSTFVLMKQNRMSMRADQRAHLDLQINMLAEREMTLVLQVLQHIAGHLGLEEKVSDLDLEELTKETHVEALASELNEKLSAE